MSETCQESNLCRQGGFAKLIKKYLSSVTSIWFSTHRNRVCATHSGRVTRGLTSRVACRLGGRKPSWLFRCLDGRKPSWLFRWLDSRKLGWFGGWLACGPESGKPSWLDSWLSHQLEKEYRKEC